MRSIVEIPKTSNGSQVVPAAALEAVERPPGGRVDELPRHDLPLCIQTIGLQWRCCQGGWSWGAQDSGMTGRRGPSEHGLLNRTGQLRRCGCRGVRHGQPKLGRGASGMR